MAEGTVKWWSDDKGYGMISQAGGQDVFVHFSAIDASGFQTLQEGAQVTFDVLQGQEGAQATNVRVKS